MPYDDWEGWRLVCLSAEGAKTVSWLWLSPLRCFEDGIVWLWFLNKIGYIYLPNLSCYGSITAPYDDWEGQMFEHSESVACHQRVLKRFLAWLSPLQGWDSLIIFLATIENIYIYIYIYIIVRKEVPATPPPFLRHPPLDLACRLFLKSLCPLSSFLFHPLSRYFRQFPWHSPKSLLP